MQSEYFKVLEKLKCHFWSNVFVGGRSLRSEKWCLELKSFLKVEIQDIVPSPFQVWEEYEGSSGISDTIEKLSLGRAMLDTIGVKRVTHL